MKLTSARITFIFLFAGFTTPVSANTYTYTYTNNGVTVMPVSSSPSDTSQATDPSSIDASTESTGPSTTETTGGTDTVNDPAIPDQGNTAATPADTTDNQGAPAETTGANGTDTPADSNSIPVASHDASSTEPSTVVNIAILSNDRNLDDLPLTVSINASPENGQIIIESDNTITYIPNNGFTGTDSLIYEVTDSNGDKAIASVSVDVQCSDCLSDVLLTLTWNPNPDEVLGYAVYFGPSAEYAVQLASELPLASGLLNPESPRVQYYLGGDLGLAQGDSVCFRLKAYNEDGYSAYSPAACIDSVI